ncbi:hypothetical protein PSTT_09970 [Puccinia striiformis]|uniref:Transcription elongation factor SPT4 n=1 Tax=Puccinia striiformis TaxID=27350 RepID=A0A2S4V6A1_9BASI|nr:hypothetical protein PSTT_09970 [Puccinia striiformis]
MAPSSKLRACMICSFVQSAAQFRKIGCPNCEEFLEMKGSPDRVVECTSGTFDGTVAMMNPKESWVVCNLSPVSISSRNDSLSTRA